MVTESDRWLRVLRPLGLLLLFIAVIRGLPERTKPAIPTIDCDAGTNAADTARLERCLDLRPDDVELMMDLGRAYERAAQWDRAEAIYRRALDADPDDGDAHVRLGDMLLRHGDAAGAGREGAAALKLQPGGSAATDLIERAKAGTAR